MKSKYLILTAILAILLACTNLSAQVLVPSVRDSRTVVSLNGNWKFKYFSAVQPVTDSLFFQPSYDVSKWLDIKVPGNWELQGFAEPFYGKNLQAGTGLYRTGFTVPQTWNGNPVYIAFDGVEFGYSVWVNGKYAGAFASAFNRQTFDISKLVLPGKTNTLAVKVTTHPKGWEFDTNDDWALSGISRNVTLFSLAPVHIKDFTVKTFLHEANASIDINALIEKTPTVGFPLNLALTGQMLDASGKLVKEFTISNKQTGTVVDELRFTETISVSQPKLWTAETPYLYTLRLLLKSNAMELQQYTERIGIREVTWANGILKLNGSPIKLRGATHHDISPINGRAITETELRKDLQLMQEANINFLRTSHYPPNPRLLELCDSMGMYVMDEVPYGFGDVHLSDTSYLPLLLQRAKSTIWRDKNHPSILIWSVGNENPITNIGLQTGRYVKSLDATRPYCFPQVGSYFGKQAETFPDSIDILSPHYVVPATLLGYANRFNRPMIVTEYAHALGLDFDRVEALWEIMYAHPKLAGGAVWEFFDQGILRKTSEKIKPTDVTTSVWLDSVTVYDNHGNEGADGLVYANRIPQVDYWQVRKVYTPVKAMDDTFHLVPGKQTVQLKLINRYDFTNLSETQCRWTLYADTAVLEKGTASMSCTPHDTLHLGISINIPQQPTACYYYLKVQFANKRNYIFYEKTYLIRLPNHAPDWLQKLAAKTVKPSLNSSTISFGPFGLQLNSNTGMFRLTNATAEPLVLDGPYARMSRKATMSELATTGKTSTAGKQVDPLLAEKPVEVNSPIWMPHLLAKPTIKVESITANCMVVNYTYEKDIPKGQFVEGKVEYNISDSGRIDINYRFMLRNATGIALEAGLSFLVPASLTEFRWVGKGPYPAFPGKNRLDEFGLYHLNSADINYQGNRENVDIAILSDAKGKGIAIVANSADIAVEQSPEGIVVSHNAYVSGRFNKGVFPEDKVRLEALKEISGSFSLVPLNGSWPTALQRLFGVPTRTAVPFKPFYNSYDQ